MRVVFALFVIALGPLAQAQPTSAYYGVALGSFDYEESNPFALDSIADATDSYRLMVGYQFTDHLAVEGGWGKTGTIRDTQSFVGQNGTTTFTFTSDFQIFVVRMLGVLPFDNGVTLLGGLGYAEMKEDVTISAPGFGILSGDSDGGEATLYGGVQYDWDRFALRVAYEKYDFGGGIDVSEASVGFFYKL